MRTKKTVFWLVVFSLTLGLFFNLYSHFSLKEAVAARSSTGAKTYYCPMHPSVVSDKPGDCPVCHMRLIPAEGEKTASSGAVVSPDEGAAKDPNAICVLHECPMVKEGQPCPMLILAEKGEKLKCPVCDEAIATETGPRRILFYRHPMRPEVSSPVPAKDEMGMDYIPVYSDEIGGKESGRPSLTGYASILISPERQQLIGIRTGIVERKEAFKTVRAAGRIAYDPDLYQAESEYLESHKSFLKAQSGGDASAMDWSSKLLESAKTKLTRMGLNAGMIQELGTQAGPDKSLLYAVPDGNAWVYADIYEYEIPLVKVGDELNVQVSSSQGKALKGIIRAVDTVVNPSTRTVRVRALVKNEAGMLKPDMYVNVWLEMSLGEAILVPEEAIFFAGETKIVFVDKGRGLFEPRQVVLGQKTENTYVVNKGLSEGEKVVTNGNFLVDSESKLKAALSSIGSHSHGG
ncbi:MAG: efflux RND transporter periplasmic adaptor subunit [Candidatus Omnitrophica bacterium]|nr:efflux RND transporter periplasmic adaptor subunit [Candidatus Omnitrophota bacterium]